jgi:hypothetical protein
MQDELGVSDLDSRGGFQIDNLEKVALPPDIVAFAVPVLSAGVDKMTVTDLKPWLQAHWPEVKERLLPGTYRPEVEFRRPAYELRVPQEIL